MPIDSNRERRRGIIWLLVSLVFLALMFAGWWLVETTNEEGTHDAELLPFLALIPLALAAFHLVRARLHRT